MLKFKDIKDSFIQKISENFSEKIYDEKIQQGFESPAFFIQLIPVNSVRENKNTKSKMLLVDIQYFPDDKNSYDEALNKANDLELIFENYIEINDRKIKLDNIDFQIFNDEFGVVLHFQITINYFECINLVNNINEEKINEIIINKE